MTKRACCRLPMTMIAGTSTNALGHHASAAAIAKAIAATSASTASVARTAERRVSSRTTSGGSARRKSSLNSSPRKLRVDAAEQDVLHLEVFLEAVLRALAPEARLLDAAEWGDLRGDDAHVRADDAGLHLLRHTEDAADVAAVEVAGEAELGVVREADDLVLRLEADERRDWAERLFKGDDHVGRDVRHHGRLEEEPAALVALAAQDDLRALADGVGDVLLGLLHALLVDQRPDYDAGL